MIGTDASNTKEPSSKGFFHWLKNTWLGKLWNYIVSCFRPKKQKTEFQPASAKQEKNDGNNNDKSQSPEVVQNKVNESNTIEKNEKLNSTDEMTPLDNSKLKNRAQKPKTRPPSREKRHDDAKSSSQSGEEVFDEKYMQKRDSDSSQTPVNPKSPAMSRSKSEPTLIPPLELPANMLFRSQSLSANLNDISKQEKLEWDHGFDIDSPKKNENSEFSSQPEQKLGSSDIEEEKGDDEAEKRGQSKPKTQHISRSNVTKNRSKQKERGKKVLENQKAIHSKDEEKGKAILENSNKKLGEAAERKQIEDKKKSEKARNMRNRSNDRSVHNGSGPGSSLSGSNSSLSSQNGKGH